MGYALTETESPIGDKQSEKALLFSETCTSNTREAWAVRPPSMTCINIQRALWIAAGVTVWYFNDTIQGHVNSLWTYLLSTWVYNCVYFETWWAAFCYPLCLVIPLTLHKIRYFDNYKLDNNIQWKDDGFMKAFLEAVIYVTPLMAMDTFMVKHYPGVDPKEWQIRRASLLQYTRALPIEPPTVWQVFYQLVLSIIIYDFLFFLVHLAVHKNMWLYKNVHAFHHDHPTIHSRVTNQLTVLERTLLVLSANEALKIMYSHPLTRTMFVPLFLWMITENHYGYDLPCTLDKLIPFGLAGGSAKHYEHHVYGSRHYQPFFTYIDKFFSYKNGKVKSS